MKGTELPAPVALLFDWDNTLVDNWATIHDAMNHTLVAMGMAPWTAEQARLRIRASARDSFPKLFGERWQEARDIFYGRFMAKHLETLRPKRGADELVRGAARAGLFLGVISNKRGDLVRAEAEALGWLGLFGAIVGADDAEADKPSAATVEMALAGTGIAPGPEVWLVGDTAIDMATARNADCAAVLIGEGEEDGTEWSYVEPDLQLIDCEALGALVASP